MLWTDAEIVTQADLVTLDSEVASVAQACDITVADVIRRATDEAGTQLLVHCEQFGGFPNNGDVSQNHYAAVMNTGLTYSNRSKLLLNQIVVSPGPGQTWSPLKRWIAYWCLTQLYRDAASRAQGDRYQIKYEQNLQLTHGRYWQAVRALGVPYVAQPLPCPGAAFEYDPGTWDPSAASLVAGSGTSTATVNVQVSWLDGGRAVNNESAPSNPLSVQLQTGKVLRVDISALNPPTGAQPAATLPITSMAYGNATAWHVYVNGVRQTPAGGVPIGTKQFLLTGDPVATGAKVGTGQFPELYLPIVTGIIQRG